MLFGGEPSADPWHNPPMIDHAGLHADPVEQSGVSQPAFYEAALAPLGYSPCCARFRRSSPGMVVFGMGWRRSRTSGSRRARPRRRACTSLFAPRVGRRSMRSMRRRSRRVGAITGRRGPRPHYHEHYYGAFVLDPDGHNIEAVIHTGLARRLHPGGR